VFDNLYYVGVGYTGSWLLTTTEGLILLDAVYDAAIAKFGVPATVQIAATVGLKNTFTGDTLCDESKPIVLEAIKFPEPVIAVAIEPKTKDDQERMGDSLTRLVEEDPTFKARYDK